MQSITFNELPQAVTLLTKEVSELKQLLIAHKEKPIPDQLDKLMSVKEAAKFLNLSVPTIYSKVSKRELPFMKRGNRLYFSTTELIQYLKEGRGSTYNEIISKADNYFKTKNQ